MTMGVITICDIDYGVIFGPFPSSEIKMDPTYLIGLMTKDRLPTHGQIKVSPSTSVNMARAIEWLPYILPARNEEEQNMEAYMKNGKVFYRTLRIIKATEELLVWYSKDFCQLIDIPEVKRATEHDIENYVCSYCGEMFDHVFPLRAHLRFKCEGNSKQREITSSRESELTILDLTQNIQNSHEIRERKRDNEENDNYPHRKIFVQENTENEHPHLGSKSLHKIDHNDNVRGMRNVEECSNMSAFRKVSKAISPVGTDVLSVSNLCQVNPVQNNFMYSPHQGKSSFDSINRTVTDNSIITAPMADNMASSSRLSYEQKSSSKELLRLNGLYPTYGGVARKLEGIGMGTIKQVMFTERCNAGVPYSKSSNPMVEKLLSSVSPTTINIPLHNLALSQNWCAKCNASFRMTSDLVYHMRSHHKREFDPVKKKRDDKLKCNICHETFRERHHLTRHMTSHA